MSQLTFDELRAANVTRCNGAFHPIEEWSPTDWACAMAGEAGEACNVVKKIRRIWPSQELAHQECIRQDEHDMALLVELLAEEIADTIIYADLLAARMGIDLGRSVSEKFNKVSRRVGSNVRLDPWRPA